MIKIKNPNLNNNRLVNFGETVVYYKDRLLVSASSMGAEDAVNDGLVYLFNTNTKAVIHIFKNTVDEFSESNYLEEALLMDDRHIVISAEVYSSEQETSRTLVHVYSAKTFEFLRTLEPPNPESSGFYADLNVPAAMNNDYFFFSTIQDINPTTESASGKVYVFSRQTLDLVETLSADLDENFENNNFGASIEVNEDYTIVSAESYETSPLNIGRLYIFRNSDWGLEKTIDFPYEDGTHEFALVMDLKGNTLVTNFYGVNSEGGQGGLCYYEDFRTLTPPVLINKAPMNETLYSYERKSWRVVRLTENYIVVREIREDYNLNTFETLVVISRQTKTILRILSKEAPFDKMKVLFGWGQNAISIYGNSVAVGAMDELRSTALLAGSVYTFDLDSGLMTNVFLNVGTFGASAYDFFGISIAAKGKKLLALSSDYDQSGNGETEGASLLFNLETHALIKSNVVSHGQTIRIYKRMTSISIGKTIIAVGFEDADMAFDGSYQGAVQILDINTGAVLATLTNNGPSNNYQSFGASVLVCTPEGAPDDSVIFISAPRATHMGSVGVVHSFSWPSGILIDSIWCPDTGVVSGESFGSALSLVGNELFVGCGRSSLSGMLTGAVYVINLDTMAASMLNTHSPLSDDKYFGTAIKAYGNKVLVSSRLVGLNTFGALHIFRADTKALLHTFNPPANHGRVYCSYAESFDINDDEIAISVMFSDDPDTNEKDGYVEIYDRHDYSSLKCIIRNPNTSGASSTDMFARSVAYSDDYLIISACGESDEKGKTSGVIYLYKKNLNTYTIDSIKKTLTVARSMTVENSAAIAENLIDIGVKMENLANASTTEAIAFLHKERSMLRFFSDFESTYNEDKLESDEASLKIREISEEFEKATSALKLRSGINFDIFDISKTSEFSEVNDAVKNEIIALSDTLETISKSSKSLITTIGSKSNHKDSLSLLLKIFRVIKKCLETTLRLARTNLLKIQDLSVVINDASYILEKADGYGLSIDRISEKTDKEKEDYFNEQYY